MDRQHQVRLWESTSVFVDSSYRVLQPVRRRALDLVVKEGPVPVSEGAPAPYDRAGYRGRGVPVLVIVVRLPALFPAPVEAGVGLEELAVYIFRTRPIDGYAPLLELSKDA